VSPRIAICDYGVGNLRSVERAVLASGGDAAITRDAEVIAAADGVVLPGVGAFAPAADALTTTGLGEVVLEVAASGRPLLGVCLGHQLLFEWSEENGGRAGLGLLRGAVSRLGPERGKVPHMGWNRLQLLRDSVLTEGIEDGAYVYFVHSYASPAGGPDVVATCDFGGPIAAICVRDNVWGTQFHPEKSGPTGLRLYANFVRACAATPSARR
jgi:glutamine amidotransferase